MPVAVTRFIPDRGFETSVNEHVVRSDLPTTMGGAGAEPTPTDLFVASLGSCVASFVLFHCRRTGLEVRGMHVDVEYSQRTAPGKLTSLRVVISVPNADVEMHRGALLGAAEHCPIGEAIETIGSIDFVIAGDED
jgi:uncharacterized OsmC-like protein